MRVFASVTGLVIVSLTSCVSKSVGIGADRQDDLTASLSVVSTEYCSLPLESAVTVRARVNLRNGGTPVTLVKGAQAVLYFALEYRDVAGVLGTTEVGSRLLPDEDVSPTLSPGDLVYLPHGGVHSFEVALRFAVSGTHEGRRDGSPIEYTLPSAFRVIVSPAITVNALSNAERQRLQTVALRAPLAVSSVRAAPFELSLRVPERLTDCR